MYRYEKEKARSFVISVISTLVPLNLLSPSKVYCFFQSEWKEEGIGKSTSMFLRGFMANKKGMERGCSLCLSFFFFLV